MFGIDDRALKITWTIFLFGLLLAVIYQIRSTLIVFACAIFFAYMLSPVVELVGRLIPRRRTLALAIVYIVLVGGIVGVGFVLVPTLAEQATSLVTRLPTLITSTNRLNSMPLPQWLDPMREQIIAAANREAGNLEASVVPFLQHAGTRLLSGASLILATILIPILAFFFLKDGEAINRKLLGQMDRDRDRNTLRQILDDVHDALKHYIRALVMLSLISFAIWTLFLKLMGVQYELLLAGMAALLEFIPVVGPAVAGVVIVVVAAVTGSNGILWIIVFWGVYRLFQDYILNPYLMKAGLELHPLLVLFGVLAGDQVAGIAGMFFSVPVLAILRVVYDNLRSAYERKRFLGSSLPPNAPTLPEIEPASALKS